MRLRLLTVALAVGVGCGKASTTAPTRPVAPQPPAPQPVTVAMRVTATNGGQPLSGVSVTAGTFSAVTDGSGAANYQALPASNVGLALSGAGIVPRTVVIAANASRDVEIDAISTAGFDLNFYRQLVRNAYSEPASLQPLRRWTQPPQIYLRTIDEAGTPIDARTLETTARTLIDTAAMWTGGRFGLAGLERGTHTRAGVPGWITVRWPLETGFCGSADVARDGGIIDLNYKAGGGCRCAGVSEIRPRTVRHELGHAFGFWHTDSTSDLMSGKGVVGCDALPSARERAAAAVAYARPVGNLDPDVDPSSAVKLAPLVARSPDSRLPAQSTRSRPAAR